jgi:hypothetical protein
VATIHLRARAPARRELMGGALASVWSRSFKRFGFVALLLGLGTSAYAYTNSTAINGGKSIDAGYGQGAISGFTVSNIQYTLNPAAPDHIDQVKLDLSPTPTTGFQVWASIAGHWYQCEAGTPTICVTTVGTQLTVENAQNSTLQVSVAQ